MMKLKLLAGICAASLALSSLPTAVQAEINYGDPICDDYGQIVYTGQEFYDFYDGFGFNYFVYPGYTYWDLGTIYSQYCNYALYIPALNSYTMLQPDFSNSYAWLGSWSSYNTPELWGQCTWFAWGRFMEIYGFDPGFYGDGYECAQQLVNYLPFSFYLSETPVAGAVFSSDAAHNHVGIVLWVDDSGQYMIIQEGNLDHASNPDWQEATQDYWTRYVSIYQLRANYGDVVFANPMDGGFSWMW